MADINAAARSITPGEAARQDDGNTRTGAQRRFVRPRADPRIVISVGHASAKCAFGATAALRRRRCVISSGVMAAIGIDDCRRIGVPLCLLDGDSSPRSALQVTRLLRDALPQAQGHCVPGGHMATLSHPAWVTPVDRGLHSGRSATTESYLPGPLTVCSVTRKTVKR
jgi:hypothetical protein